MEIDRIVVGEECPKCGEKYKDIEYDRVDEILTLYCGCGYSWDRRPLDWRE